MGTPTNPTIYKSPPRYIRHPPTDAQRKRRNAFMSCTIFWHRTITNVDAANWQAYADRHHYTTRKGNTIRLTSWSAFLHINLYRAFSGVSLLATPPND